jgi:hypothetical protein
MRKMSTNGNAILEMLMFVPLALLLLFVGLDASLLMTTRGAARSALRDGLGAEQIITRERGIVSDFFGNPSVDEERAGLLLDTVVAKVYQNLRSVPFLSLNPEKIKVQGRLYALELDPASGTLVGAIPIGIERTLPAGTRFDISSDLPSFTFRSLAELEENVLLSGSGVHRLAQPVALSNRADLRFYPLTLALGVEITAVAGGIAPGVTQWMLGSLYGVGEATIVPLRISLS